MKVFVKRLALLEGMKAVGPFLGKHPPILENVRIGLAERYNGLCLEIEATNGRQNACFEVEADDAVDGPAFLIDHARLAAYIKADWAEDLELEEAAGRLVVRGMTKANFACSGAENWPAGPDKPEEGWTRVEGVVLAEMVRALPFVGKADYEHPLGRFLWVGEGWIFAGTPQAVWLRRVEGGARLAIDPQTAQLLLGLAEGEKSISVQGGEWFSGASWWMRAAKAETNNYDPMRFMDSLPEVDGWQELPALATLVPVIEAIDSLASETESRRGATLRAVRIDPDGAGGAKVSIHGDLAEGEGRIPCPFPRWATYATGGLLRILRELQRVAGTEHAVRVGSFGGGMLRLETEGATALLGGVKV